MFGKRANRRRLRFEALEGRLMMDGSVWVNSINGTLYIKGDDFDNQLLITCTDKPGEFSVSGLDNTMVRARFMPPAPCMTFKGIHSINVCMLGGDDTVIATAVSGYNDAKDVITFDLCKDFSADLGRGNDQLILSFGHVGGSACINANHGCDTVLVGFACVNSGINFEMPPIPHEKQLFYGALDVCKSLTVATGAGCDEVGVTAVHVGCCLDVSGCNIHELAIFEVRAGQSTRLSTGWGDNCVTIDRLDTKYLVLCTGAGDDKVRIGSTNYSNDGKQIPDFGLKACTVRIDTGCDNDCVQLSGALIVRDLCITLGSGWDKLDLGSPLPIAVFGRAIIDGGHGRDLIFNNPDNCFGKLYLKGFECPWKPLA